MAFHHWHGIFAPAAAGHRISSAGSRKPRSWESRHYSTAFYPRAACVLSYCQPPALPLHLACGWLTAPLRAAAHYNGSTTRRPGGIGIALTMPRTRWNQAIQQTTWRYSAAAVPRLCLVENVRKGLSLSIAGREDARPLLTAA